jgi:hypothetical protein
MAQRRQQKDVLTRLTATGEEALQKLVELPGGTKVLEAANALRERVDDLTTRVRSLDPLERRVAELEHRLDALSKPKPKPKPPAGSTAAKKKTPPKAAPPKKKPAG